MNSLEEIQFTNFVADDEEIIVLSPLPSLISYSCVQTLRFSYSIFLPIVILNMSYPVSIVPYCNVTGVGTMYVNQ